jgi:hypothetical protein
MLSLDKRDISRSWRVRRPAKEDYVKARFLGSYEVLERVAFRWTPTARGGT